ncbi:hypothetical protein J2X20_002605 [Pelomonas saccharophila]|uniref:Uncharacterized protein n=1 Tax=Roseateles saccharophilus TaxID=304 RepID=A0ABU1YM62_ROSSA|nr:hypothetical protein [Roseateles saccharophilus]MDR7269947.1 hypothetical protein [Roseateles saccharophilus]
MAGIVAAGLGLNAGAKVRVLDATGKVVASGKDVTAATGAYGPIALSGSGPFRVEACGSVGDRPICVWGATNNGGTLNLTPLTSAITVLASGQSPQTLMSGAAQGLSDTALASAQTQLRTALAPALADAGLASDFDLLAGALTPGAHTGYDRLLDSVAVGLGADTQAYVTLTSRLGTGTAYLETGTTQGALSFDAAAAGVDLTGLDALFIKLVTATANIGNCQSKTIGLEALFDAAARSSVDAVSAPFTGSKDAAQLVCLRMNGILGEGEVMFGGKLLPSLLGRCDFGTGDPLCRVGFVYQNTAGLQRRLGLEQAAVKRPAGWTFLGNRLEVQATAAARLVLTRRVDSAAPDSYARSLDISIPAISVSGGGVLQCARVSQKDTSGADVALALFKKAGNGSYLSLWSVSSSDATPSLDPASGATRGNNIVSLPVPAGAAGDAVARNFVRAGRGLKIELFKDSACATPLGGLDGDAISVELAGQLPVTAASQAAQPWPALVAKAVTDLTGMKGAVNAKISYGPTWTLPRGDLLPDRALLCTDTACNSKLAELELGVVVKGAANLIGSFATGASLSATLGNTALNTNSYKLLRITGRMPDGLVLQLDSQSCSAQIAGLPC